MAKAGSDMTMLYFLSAGYALGFALVLIGFVAYERHRTGWITHDEAQGFLLGAVVWPLTLVVVVFALAAKGIQKLGNIQMRNGERRGCNARYR